MCLQWCHVTGQVVDNDYFCPHCSLWMKKPGLSCASCAHRRGQFCGLTGHPLPRSGYCCHHNATLHRFGFILLTEEHVHPAEMALHQVESIEDIFWAVETAPEPVALSPNEVWVSLQELASPWVYGIPAWLWQTELPSPRQTERQHTARAKQRIHLNQAIDLREVMMETTIETIEMDKILFSAGNPRTDAEADLEGLAISLGTEDSPNLVNLPLVRRNGEGGYLLIAGERRVRAAQKAGWTKIPCMVRGNLSATEAHGLTVAENLHRKDLTPLDLAGALKVSWLIANAIALNLGGRVEEVLSAGYPQAENAEKLETLLHEAGFSPTHPLVTWDETLDRLGVEMKPASRKKLMQLLSIDRQVQQTVNSLGLTEAALRSLGSLPQEEQRNLAEELSQNPELGRKVRRIARVVRDKGETLDAALAEARGIVGGDVENLAEQFPKPETDAGAESESAGDDERITDLVIQLLESATATRRCVDELQTLLGERFLPQLPEVWREYASDAVALLQSAVHDSAG